MKEKSKAERENMKREYGKKHHVENKRFPIPGDSVFVRAPSEKGNSEFPKLTNEWDGPYRVEELSENSAKVVRARDKSMLQIPFEQLRMIKKELENQISETVKKRKQKVADVILQNSKANNNNCEGEGWNGHEELGRSTDREIRHQRRNDHGDRQQATTK